MTLSEYSYLKQQIKISVGSSERHANLLETLKSMFRQEINSPRRYEKITSISQLLEVLELREVLSEDNIEPLRRIAEVLPMPTINELARRLSQYETLHVPREYRNYYVPERTQALSNRNSPVQTMTNGSNGHGQMSDQKQQRIFQTVVDEIGNSWRDLARNLRISEGKINEIDHKYRPLASKATSVLQCYLDTKADPEKWFFELCDALEKTRRKDLAKSITKIVTMNI